MKILECSQQYSLKRTLFTPMEAISAKTALLDRSHFAGVMFKQVNNVSHSAQLFN